MTDGRKSDLVVEFFEEFNRVTLTKRNQICGRVYRKLSKFEEASDIDYITSSCIADIERILQQQLLSPSGHFNLVEGARKLSEFEKDKSYVEKYVLEATKSFCRKKQNYWTHGRRKGDLNRGETHKAKQAGAAARIFEPNSDQTLDQWLDSLMTSSLSLDSLQPETLADLDAFFKHTVGLNQDKIDCFWLRFAGFSFVEMSELDESITESPDKYRKRYKRTLAQLNSHSSEFRTILLQDFQR
ncbi:TPA: hypothetical protein ACPKAL_003560 [Vibrio alginolyticus]|uniref:hypothetical protein n=1 Tax=Vibrio alginolyticus TaxID=663 RepID=UPI00063D8AA9|nr:hypothetical protein [Vibrio alginolyticus]KLI70774.1 hypothetical protein AAW26_18835 [Vibrio alginolyticus]MDM4740062.1 hypothetical protein [Vibrio alginolyticus]MDM4760411.1 hypothetical protein [Vibrio alginolyticus]